MYNEQVIINKLRLIAESIDIISERFSDVDTPDDFVTSPSGVTKLDSIAMRLQFIGESVKKIDKHAPKYLTLSLSLIFAKIIYLT